MPRPCTICGNPERDAIDLALASGEPARRVGAKWSVSRSAVARHSGTHLRPGAARVQALVRDQVVQSEAHGKDLLAEVQQRQARVERLVGIAEGLIGRAVQAGDLRTATGAVQAAISASREVRECLQLLAKLTGELDERPVLNLLVAPEWHQVRSALLEALLPYPDARTAVATRLIALEAA
jgi:hypothetical protein